jgi:predicted oxidoreductase
VRFDAAMPNIVECDLVIVGAGAAGIGAAIEAATAGLRVHVVEAFPSWGGTAATGSGLTLIVDSPLQRRHGIRDSVELALDDWLAWGGREEADADWARSYLEHSRSDVFAWLQDQGVLWDSVTRTEGNSVPRQHLPQGGGAAVMATLHRTATALPIEWSLSTAVVELATSAGAVTGVVVESQEGRREIGAKCVLVATGGFANNKRMLQEFGPAVPGPSRLLLGGAEQARGSGHGLLEDVEAEFVGMDRVWTYAYGIVDPDDPTEERGLAFWLTNDVWVNSAAQRFHDESRRGGASATPALFAQTPATCWSIFDDTEADRATIPDQRFRRQDGSTDGERIRDLLAHSRYIHRASTIEHLAEAAGLPSGPLVETMSEVEGWTERRLAVEPRFGRPVHDFRPIATPPFYAVQHFPLARKCLGGVRTDLSCRLVRRGGSIVDGLYAAGEVAGMAGGRLNGRAALEGTMFGPSLFSGRVASRDVARRLTAGQQATGSVSSLHSSG